MGLASIARSTRMPRPRQAATRLVASAACLLSLLGANRLAAQASPIDPAQAPRAADRTASNDAASNDAAMIDARVASEHAARVRALSAADRESFGRAEALSDECRRLFQAGRYAAAAENGEAAAEIIGRLFGKQGYEFALALDDLAGPYVKLADFPRALAVATDALAIKKQVYGNRHPEYGRSANDLALLYHASGRYDRAEPLFLEALRINQERDEPVNRAVVQHNLADMYVARGMFDRAEGLFHESLSTKRELLGDLHPEVAQTINALALLHYKRGEFILAEPLYREAVQMFKQTRGEKHPDTAAALVNLAGLHQATGDFARAVPLYEQALAVMKERLGDQHPDYASSLANLAALRWRVGDTRRAEALYQEARAVIRSALGENHPEHARVLDALAGLHQNQGHFDRAESLYRQALAIEKRAFDGKHPLHATTLGNLAGLFHRQGDLARAEPLYQEALAMTLELSGENDPDYVLVLTHLACVYAATGRPAEAELLLLKGLIRSLTNWELMGAVQSERRQLAMGRLVRYQISAYLSLLVSTGRNPAAFYRSLLPWKGAVLVRRRAAGMLDSNADPKIRALAEKLKAASIRLATLALTPPPPDRHRAWRDELARLTAEKDDLEADLKMANSERFSIDAARDVREADLQAALSDDSVLVDLVEYDCRFAPPTEQAAAWKTERRLAAFVVRRGRPVKLVDLGSAATIAAAVDAWRASFGESPEALAAASALRKQVWDPLAGAVGDAQTLYVSPDGPLTRFPLAALPGSTPGRYLLEERAVVVVPAPQLLPRLLRERSPAESRPGEAPFLLTIGDVDFDGGAPASTSSPAASATSADRSAAGPSTIRRAAVRSGEGAGFPPLPGAAREAQAVRRLFTDSVARGESRLLQKSEASETQLRAVAPACRYLHIATHGYFAPPNFRSALNSDEPSDDFRLRFQVDEEVAGFHPGLLSGLALAGANRPPVSGRDDGILTALEAAELELDAAELVTLSACETGLGAPAGGEGMLGLQRAFHAAGARNVVSSLWKVDDEATAALMTLFYENLWQKNLPAAEALRQAQLAILNAPDRITSHAARGLGGAKPLPSAGPAVPAVAGTRTEIRRWAAFQISGAGR